MHVVRSFFLFLFYFSERCCVSIGGSNGEVGKEGEIEHAPKCVAKAFVEVW